MILFPYLRVPVSKLRSRPNSGSEPGDCRAILESFNSITAGISYFPFQWTNRSEFSAEVDYLFDALNETIVEPSGSLGWLPSDEPGQTNFRIQTQFGF